MSRQREHAKLRPKRRPATLSLPEEVLQMADRRARQLDRNRSSYVAWLIRQDAAQQAA